jgi:Tfp pilus assembly protein PilF
MSENPEQIRRQALEQFQRAYEHQMKGKLDLAAELYKKSIELHPTAEAYTFLGWTYSFMGHYHDAIEECQKAIELDPDFGNPYNDIGAYLIELGDLDAAIPWLEKATQAVRYESYCFPHLNLGRVWEKKGHWERAMEEYRKSLDANPDYVLATRALNRLRGMLN